MGEQYSFNSMTMTANMVAENVPEEVLALLAREDVVIVNITRNLEDGKHAHELYSKAEAHQPQAPPPSIPDPSAVGELVEAARYVLDNYPLVGDCKFRLQSALAKLTPCNPEGAKGVQDRV